MDIRLGEFKVSEEQRAIINDILDSGRVTEGPYVKKFEDEVAKFLGVKHVIAVTNGTVALQLVAHYLKYTYDRDLTVCVPATTFPATLNAFHLCGINTILCDIDSSMCINTDKLTEDEKEAIDIIVPVSLLGYAPDMDKIMAEADYYGWVVVEDFAEAFGSSYKGKKLGSIGHFGTSSFYVSHVLQGGELGIVTTNDDEAAKIMRSMKNHGRSNVNPLEFKHDYTGSNYKTTEFCAGLAYAQMKEADAIISKRQQNVIKIFNGVHNDKLQPGKVDMSCSYLGMQFTCLTEIDRNKVIKYLEANGIESRGMFPCLANQRAYRGMGFGTGKNYPMSNFFEHHSLYIGCHHNLTDEQIQRIIKALNEVLL